jgi:hypothetical protein
MLRPDRILLWRAEQAHVESARANSVQKFLRPTRDVDRSDTVSSNRDKPLTPRAADNTTPILVPYDAGIWTFGD